MILNHFGAIILKRKELKDLFKIFIKQFQQQLTFLEEIIQNDAQEIKNEASCCHCVIKHLNCLTTSKLLRFRRFNPIFYKAFRLMSPLKRQQQFLQLLNFIELLGDIYQKYISKDQIQNTNMSKYKEVLTSNLIDKIIKKDVIKNLEQDEQSQRSCELMVNISGKGSKKVGKFSNWKFVMIQKMNGEEIKMLIDLRNYLMISYCKDRRRINLSAAYETIAPVQMEIEFTENKNAKRDFDRYVEIFTEIIKIGKIQKLVQNIDYIKLFGEDYDSKRAKEHQQHASLMNTFVKNEEEQSSMHEDQYVGSGDFLKTVTLQKKKEVRKERQESYEKIKRKLIETLNFLSEKKEKQNKKVRQFLSKKAISKPKTKSEAVIRVLNSTQAFIPPKQTAEHIPNISEEIQKDIALFALNIQNQRSCLSIINRNKQNTESKKLQKNDDSFYLDSKDNLSQQSEEFRRVFNRNSNKKTKKISYSRNMYKKLYAEEFDFGHVQYLMEMVIVQINEINYVLPDEQITKESNNLSDDKLAKFKISWLDKLGKTVKIYKRKLEPSFFKITIHFAIEVKQLVQALINIQAYHYWHPNIKNIQVVTTITSENMVLYKMEVVNPITNKSQIELMLMHLFRLEGKYYIVHKRIQDKSIQKQEEKGFLNFFHFKKGNNCFPKINFLMMRVANINKNGFCEMVISFDYKPINAKYADNAKKELFTLFLNFIFIKDYWKLSKQEMRFDGNIFSLEWIINKLSFNANYNEESEGKKAGEEDLQDVDLKHQLSLINNQVEDNRESSSQFIHSSQFYDM